MGENVLSGAIDYVPGEIGITLDQVLSFQRRHPNDYDYLYKPGLNYEHMDVNLANPILGDVRVRQALVLGLNRDAISQYLFGGKSPVAHNFVDPLDSVYSDDYRHYAYDPIAAAKLLDEAGWHMGTDGLRHDSQGNPLSIEIVTTAGNSTREDEELVFTADWKKLGIDLRIANQPARVLFGSTLRYHKYSGLALFTWVSAPHSIPRSMLSSTMIPTKDNGYAGQNYTGFSNPEMDQTLKDLEVVCGDADQKRLWTRTEQIYADNLPQLPLRYDAQAFIMPKWLTGVVPTGHQYSSAQWVEHWRGDGP